jgi:hypothetical protein
MSQSFRDLFIFERAVVLATLVAEPTRQFPSRQRYVLADQMLRSSVSVASNIAEGAGRLSRADLCRFLGIARGSLHELATPDRDRGSMSVDRRIVQAQSRTRDCPDQHRPKSMDREAQIENPNNRQAARRSHLYNRTTVRLYNSV